MNEIDSLIKNLIFDIQRLKERVGKLEDDSHPKRDFVECCKCKELIREK